MHVLSPLGGGTFARFQCVHFSRDGIFALTSLLLVICHAFSPSASMKDRSRAAADKGPRASWTVKCPGQLSVLPAASRARVRMCWPAVAPIREPSQSLWRVDKYHEQKLGSHEQISRNTRCGAHKKRDPCRDCDVDADREGACDHAPNERDGPNSPSLAS